MECVAELETMFVESWQAGVTAAGLVCAVLAACPVDDLAGPSPWVKEASARDTGALHDAILSRSAAGAGAGPPGGLVVGQEQRGAALAAGARLLESSLGHSEPRARRLATDLAFYVSQRGAAPERAAVRSVSLARIRECLDDSPAARQDATGETVLHESAGWRGLDAALHALRAALLGGGRLSAGPEGGEASGLAALLAPAPGLLARCSCSRNRFVREAALGVVEAAVLAAGPAEALEASPAGPDGPGVVVSSLCGCLDDNWSQVRLAASSTARRVLLAAVAQSAAAPAAAASLGPDAEWAGTFAPIAAELLPRLCLNRYDVADGVRNHAQGTWRALLAARPAAGLEAVCRHVSPLAAYCASEAGSANHNIRVTACHVIGELGEKLPAEALRGEAEGLVSALRAGLGDARWHVRAAACGALGRWARGPMAAEALGWLGGEEEAVSALLSLSGEGAWAVREQAAGAVADFAVSSAAVRERVLGWAAGALDAAAEGSCLSGLRAAWDEAGGDAGAGGGVPGEEPPDVDYDSDGGRDDDAPARHRAVEDGAAGRPHRWSSAPRAAAGASAGAAAPAEDAPTPARGGAAGDGASALASRRAQGAGMVVAAMATDGSSKALLAPLAELARRAAGMGACAGGLVSASLRSLRAAAQASPARAAKSVVAEACGAAVAALSIEASSPASGTAARGLVVGLVATLGKAAVEARLDAAVKAALDREGLLEPGARGSHPSMPAAVSVRVAESGRIA